MQFTQAGLVRHLYEDVICLKNVESKDERKQAGCTKVGSARNCGVIIFGTNECGRFSKTWNNTLWLRWYRLKLRLIQMWSSFRSFSEQNWKFGRLPPQHRDPSPNKCTSNDLHLTLALYFSQNAMDSCNLSLLFLRVNEWTDGDGDGDGNGGRIIMIYLTFTCSTRKGGIVASRIRRESSLMTCSGVIDWPVL